MTITVNNYHPGSYVPGEVIMMDITLTDPDATFLSASFDLYTSYESVPNNVFTKVNVQRATITQEVEDHTINGTLTFVLDKDNIIKEMDGYELFVSLTTYTNEEHPLGVITGYVVSGSIDGPTKYFRPYTTTISNATYHVPNIIFNVKRKSIGIGCLARPQARIIRFNNGITKSGFYPVGSLYFSIYDINPTNYFGGTWELYCPGRALVGVDEEDEDFSSAANDWTKGEREVTLTIDTMPAHTHSWRDEKTMGDGSSYARMRAFTAYTSKGFATSYTGGDSPHNNLQPYVTCYIWVRVA